MLKNSLLGLVINLVVSIILAVIFTGLTLEYFTYFFIGLLFISTVNEFLKVFLKDAYPLFITILGMTLIIFGFLVNPLTNYSIYVILFFMTLMYIFRYF